VDAATSRHGAPGGPASRRRSSSSSGRAQRRSRSRHVPRSRATSSDLAPHRAIARRVVAPAAAVAGPASVVVGVASPVLRSRGTSRNLQLRPPISPSRPPISRRVLRSHTPSSNVAQGPWSQLGRRSISRRVVPSCAASCDLRPRRCEPYPSSLDPRRRRVRHTRRLPISRIVVSGRAALRDLAPRPPASRHVPRSRVTPSDLAPRPSPSCDPRRLRAASPTRARRSLHPLHPASRSRSPGASRRGNLRS